MNAYMCKACGFIYNPLDGDPLNNIPPNTPFEKLPDTWRCPMCGAPKSMFKPMPTKS
ncbi:MAG: rubredoxin [bacterium]|nr:rubredoxin [bacterium]